MTVSLSIIIPAYNAEAYIAETVESALAQTIKDREIIIVNDGSNDSTWEMCTRYEKFGVKLFNNSPNRGANYTYNYGFLHSSGEYVTFLDSDDLYLPEYCQVILGEMRHVGADIGFSNLYVLEGRNKTSTTLYGEPRHHSWTQLFGGPSGRFPNDDMMQARNMILRGVHISPRSIYRRRLFLDYGMEDSRLRVTHDWLRNIKFMLHGARCVYVDRPLGFYRMHSQGNSQKDALGNLVENAKLMEIVLHDCQDVMTADERHVARLAYANFRGQVFDTLAKSELTNRQIMQFLIERNFPL